MKITVETTVHAPIEKVWECWTDIKHINGWAFASDDWQADAKENDIKAGGTFKTTMSAKDGSAHFDFEGTYIVVEDHQRIEYDMDDGRHVRILFEAVPEGVKITETFEAENENPEEMQRAGWQTFLDNFKTYTESIT